MQDRKPLPFGDFLKTIELQQAEVVRPDPVHHALRYSNPSRDGLKLMLKSAGVPFRETGQNIVVCGTQWMFDMTGTLTGVKPV